MTTYNLNAISSPYFKIGDVTIYQTSSDPSLTYTVNESDLWIDKTNKILKVYSTSAWKEVLQEGNASASDISGLATVATTGRYLDLSAKIDAVGTGVLHGGILSINADNTKFDMSAGTAVFVDYTDPENPTINMVEFGPFTAVSVPTIATAPTTYVAINNLGEIVQSTIDFTATQRRTHAVIGLLVHSNNVNLNLVNQLTTAMSGVANQLHDFMYAIGPLNLTGNRYTANGANLSLDKSAGVVFKVGSNWGNNPLVPHNLSIAGGTAITFRYRKRDSVEYADTTVIDPNNYDNAGVLTALSNNFYSIQRINLFQSGVTRIQYGQAQYSTMDAALAALDSELFVTESNIAANAIYRAYLIVKKGTTSLQNAADAKIVEVGKFGTTVGGASGTLTGYASLSAANTFTNSQTITGDITISTGEPRLKIYETDATADNKGWDFFASAGQLWGRVYNDLDNTRTNWITISRTGTTPTLIDFGAPVQGTNINARRFVSTVNARGGISGAQVLDLSLGDYITATIAGATTFSFTNPIGSGSAAGFVLELTNGGVGAITWPASVKWPIGTAPTLTASGVDILVFSTRDGGTTWRGLLSQKDSK